MTNNLGRLQKVDLREAWTSESSHFTPWLAQEENLESLWPQHFEWLRQRLETMHRVFAPMVKKLRVEEGE